MRSSIRVWIPVSISVDVVLCCNSNKISGMIEPWGTASSTARRIDNVDAELCGVLAKNLVVDISGSDCEKCDKSPLLIKSVSKTSYVVLRKDGNVIGSIEGRLPKC